MTSMLIILEPHDENVSVQRFFTRESAVLYALDQASLQKFPAVLAGGIARVANMKLESEGERLQLSARAAGAILNKLGFKTEKIGSYGRGFWMTQEVKKRLNNLSHHYGIVLSSPVNGTETERDGGKEPGKKPSPTAPLDGHKDRRAKKRKKRT